MAVLSNSPIVFGRRLWAETRIALFRQAVDDRSRKNHLRETEARVNFGTRWVRKSVVEIFKEDVTRFRALVGTDLDDPMALLGRGEIPQLKALRLHNGTIYRWNRACYGITDGKPHLRIENRVMPAGPSTLDEMANAAFWTGLMVEMGARDEDVTRRIDFDQAAANFYTAAREGIGSHFEWFDGEDITARRSCSSACCRWPRRACAGRRSPTRTCTSTSASSRSACARHAPARAGSCRRGTRYAIGRARPSARTRWSPRPRRAS